MLEYGKRQGETLRHEIEEKETKLNILVDAPRDCVWNNHFTIRFICTLSCLTVGILMLPSSLYVVLHLLSASFSLHVDTISFSFPISSLLLF